MDKSKQKVFRFLWLSRMRTVRFITTMFLRHCVKTRYKLAARQQNGKRPNITPWQLNIIYCHYDVWEQKWFLHVCRTSYDLLLQFPLFMYSELEQRFRNVHFWPAKLLWEFILRRNFHEQYKCVGRERLRDENKTAKTYINMSSITPSTDDAVHGAKVECSLSQWLNTESCCVRFWEPG